MPMPRLKGRGYGAMFARGQGVALVRQRLRSVGVRERFVLLLLRYRWRLFG